MSSRARIVVPALFLSLCSAGCPDAGGGATPPAFDAERAWKGLLHQVEIGPRPSGTPANETCRQWIESELRGMGLEPARETFTDKTPAGDIQFSNVYAELPGTDPKAGWIFVGSHFDTKRMSFRFVGANDGASSTAALIEVARSIAQGGKRAIGYRFVFFDGEEAIREEWLGDDNTYGSRHHVKVLRENGRLDSLRAFVLLDMVGDKDLKLTSDTLSDRKLMETFTKAARDIGLGRHVGGKSMEVRDDHVPFLMARVRAVDLIDFDFGPNNAYWHTDKDTVENCSKESLDAIGRITLRGLADLEASLAPR
ncbi:MAG: M28 family peptidase [Planctomycetota bacterium]|nr:M28 family peptidase [Planctomycetota bacterium]